MNQSILLQNQPKITHDARCLVIRVGRALEQCIESRARELAIGHSELDIKAGHVLTATQEFLDEKLPRLSQLIEETIRECRENFSDVA